jgi:hypothetical protein
MAYKIKGNCIFKKSNNKKIGCTKGSVKKYLSALHTNVREVNESDEFEWIDDSFHIDSLLRYNGREIMIDVSRLKPDEVRLLQKKLLPHVIETDELYNDEGEEIYWPNNCLTTNMNFKTISLHCGIEDNNFKPVKGAVCCIDSTYHDESPESKLNIIPVDAEYIIYGDKINEYKNLSKKIKSFLLTEGRYDSITRKVVKDIVRIITKRDYNSHDLPWDVSGEMEYEQEGMSFSVELNLIQTDDVDKFEVRTSISDDNDENVIMMRIELGTNFTQQNLEKLFYKLQEDVRHEIEHFTQKGFYRIKDRPVYKGSTSNLKTVYGHHKNIIEVPALVHGFYRRAKLEKRPIDEIMIEDLDSEIERGSLNKRQAESLLKIWINYAKKNIPKAVYGKK